MTDTFADLWSTAAPASSAPQKPRKLNDLISSTTPTQPTRPQNDLFALLAASNSSSNSTSRTSSPRTTNQAQLRSNSPKPTPSNGDAFSGLLSGSLGNGPANSGKLSLAEQAAAKAEKERREGLLGSNQQAAKKTQSSAWVGLDSLGTTLSFTPPPPKQTTEQKQDEFDWLFDAPASTSSKPAPPPPPAKKPPVIPDEDDDWGLSDFGSKPTSPPAPRQKPAKPSSIWDLEDAEHSNQPSPPPRKTTRPDSPGEDFDFGSREDRLLDNDSNDEDDGFRSLSKPVRSVPPRLPPVSSGTHRHWPHADAFPGSNSEFNSQGSYKFSSPAYNRANRRDGFRTRRSSERARRHGHRHQCRSGS